MIVRLPNDGPSPMREIISQRIHARAAIKQAQREEAHRAAISPNRVRQPSAAWSMISPEGVKHGRTSLIVEARLAIITKAVIDGCDTNVLIAAATGMDATWIKKLSKKAYAHGFITGTVEPAGKTRRFVYSATPKGREFVAMMFPARRAEALEVAA